MIAFEDENLIPISQVHAELPNRPHKSTVWTSNKRGRSSFTFPWAGREGEVYG